MWWTSGHLQPYLCISSGHPTFCKPGMCCSRLENRVSEDKGLACGSLRSRFRNGYTEFAHVCRCCRIASLIDRRHRHTTAVAYLVPLHDDRHYRPWHIALYNEAMWVHSSE